MKNILPFFVLICLSFLVVCCGETGNETQEEQDYPRPAREEKFPGPVREIPPVNR